jgi:hypothetical protein
MELQAPWVNGVSDGLSVKELETVHRVVTALQKNWREEMNLTSAANGARFGHSGRSAPLLSDVPHAATTAFQRPPAEAFG